MRHKSTKRQKIGSGTGVGILNPYTALNTLAIRGSRSNAANWLSFTGSDMLQKSRLEPVPIISSLINGLPKRCI